MQNFRAKPDTLMANAPEPSLDELLWTVESTRLMFGPEMNIQVPPNLNRGDLQPLLAAGSTIGVGFSCNTRLCESGSPVATSGIFS